MPENSDIENNFNRLCERMNIDPSNTVKDKLVLIYNTTKDMGEFISPKTYYGLELVIKNHFCLENLC